MESRSPAFRRSQKHGEESRLQLKDLKPNRGRMRKQFVAVGEVALGVGVAINLLELFWFFFN
jgi:hypothetical protein